MPFALEGIMEVGELFSSYFNIEQAQMPYSNDLEYLIDQLSLVDIILNVACAYKGMDQASAPLNVSNVHLRGLL